MKDDKTVLWSDGEIAFGKFTVYLNAGDRKIFSEFQSDFVEILIEYLYNEGKNISFDTESDRISKAFSNLNCVWKCLKPQERDAFQSNDYDYMDVNIICFNYTHTVDKCVDVVKKNSLSFEGISHYPDLQKVHINNICHVHGSLGRPIIFAVNDESQIANPDIFNCQNGNIYRDLFIKRNANAAYKENNDITASEMLKESDIICIYGMSIGPTDGIWWEC